jgi:predicted alpha/beta hydrolase
MGDDLGVRGTALAADGSRLAVTRFAARGEAWATMCVAGAMGARQDFYAPFARFLAGNGIHVLTFDYQGMGWSPPKKPRDFQGSVADWAEKDLASMLAHAREPAPRLPLLMLGHSLGGQILGITPDNAAVRASLHVTAGSGWYKLNDRMPTQVRLLWFFLMPVLLPIFGYFPGKRLKIVGDLPLHVAWQWRRWCLHPDYLLSEPGARASFDRVKAPILAYSFTDDPLITRAAVERLNAFYRNAALEHRHEAPADAGVAQIGHFGFFSEASRETLWKDALAWLRAKAQRNPEAAVAHAAA